MSLLRAGGKKGRKGMETRKQSANAGPTMPFFFLFSTLSLGGTVTYVIKAST